MFSGNPVLRSPRCQPKHRQKNTYNYATLISSIHSLKNSANTAIFAKKQICPKTCILCSF